MHNVDQAIFVLVCFTTLLLLSTVMHSMYIDMGIDTRAGKKYAQAYSSKLGFACVTFHIGTVLLAAVMPLWAFRKFGLSWVFYVCACIPPGWLFYDFGVSLPAHIELNQLLAHAELGLEVADRKQLWMNWQTVTGGHCWTAEGWAAEAQRRKLGGEDAPREELAQV